MNQVVPGQAWPDKLLDKVAAEKVGKRLERQAQRVRDELAAAHEAAASDRARVEARGGDAATLAAIDVALQRAIDHAHNEVYVGFTELESLMPVADPEPELEPVLEPEPKAEPRVAARPRSPPSPSVNRTICELYGALEAQGVRYPAYLVPDEQEDHSIPSDLVAALGDDAAQELRTVSEIPYVGDKWWELGLPSLCRCYGLGRNVIGH